MRRLRGVAAVLVLVLLTNTSTGDEQLPPRALARLGAVRPFHQGEIEALAFAPNGKVVASAGRDHLVRLWDVQTGRELRQLPQPARAITALFFADDGDTLTLIPGPRDNTIHQWHVRTGREVHHWSGVKHGIERVALSPDGKLLAVADTEGGVSLRVAATGWEVRRLPGSAGSTLLALAFTADGQTLWAASADHTARAWTVSNGRQVIQLRFRTGTAREWGCATLTPDGRLAVATRETGVVSLWDLGGGRLLRRFPRQEKDVTALAFSADGKQLAAANNAGLIFLSDLRSGKTLQLVGHTDRVAAVTFSPDGRLLASGGEDGSVRLWDTATGKENRHGPAQEAVTSLACMPDGRTIVTGTAAGMLHIWDKKTARELRRLPGHAGSVEGIALAPDGKTLASVSKDRTVRLWDIATGREIRRLGGYDSRLLCVAFSPDGKLLATGGGVLGTEHAVLLWDVATGKEVRRLPGHRNGVLALAFLPDGHTLVSSGDDRVLRFWDVFTGVLLRAEPSVGADTRIVLSADGKTLASAELSGITRVWETLSGRSRRLLADRQATPYCLALAPDGRLLATAGWGGTVTLWDLATGRKLLQLSGHRHHVYALAFDPAGRTLVSGSLDGTALVWDVAGILPAVERRQPSAEELEVLWADLTGEDGAKAYAALWGLVAARQHAEGFLSRRVIGLQLPSDRAIAQRVANLDHDRFKVRQAAHEQLERWGGAAAPALRQALAKHPSPEVRWRARDILAKLTANRSRLERVNAGRVVEVLERMDTSQARRALAALGGGAQESYVTQEARAALRRLGRRADVP